jgi:hypothetical protein
MGAKHIAMQLWEEHKREWSWEDCQAQAKLEADRAWHDFYNSSHVDTSSHVDPAPAPALPVPQTPPPLPPPATAPSDGPSEEPGRKGRKENRPFPKPKPKRKKRAAPGAAVVIDDHRPLGGGEDPDYGGGPPGSAGAGPAGSAKAEAVASVVAAAVKAIGGWA